eukprot:TRINITY_DN61392_c0_g1_i1.p1 TRINITY_DN61392_c0_g1~~TRINITY_DN61392_c0_g1_i1.p1  ORF type:complete len:485 (-),score=96.00 TRINITY_DN61392_c0_g1_i1:340-1794(-)
MQRMHEPLLGLRIGRRWATPLQTGPRFLGLRATSAITKADPAQRGTYQWGPVSIPEGTRYAIWNRFSGACEQFDGPKRVWVAGSRVEPLTLHTASPDEYLAVYHRDGGVQHIPGPASIWEDPVSQSKVEVMKALQVGSNEAIVVYREEAQDSSQRIIKRSILSGPMLYVPSGLEWLHTFVWHGTVQETLKKPVQLKMPGLLRFQKLRLTPDQIYFDVPNVRTRDDALLTVKVMVFLQLRDIDVMLNATCDPVSEFMNSLSADIIDFTGSRSFEQFKGDLEDLNRMDVYPHLSTRASSIGFTVSKVIFRGYLASERLQEMHDEAIHKRTELMLQKETQEQEQDLKDFKLDRDSARAERLADFKLRRAQERQAIEKERVEHQEQINDVQASASLQRELSAHEQAMAIEAGSHAQRLNQQKVEHACSEEHYTALQRLGVDLSRYLAVVARGPAQRVIEVDTGHGGKAAAAPQLHIHSNDSGRAAAKE